MLIYCDSVILIYMLDQVGPFHLRALRRMAALQSAGDRAAISDLTRLECRVGPLKRKDTAALSAIEGFLAQPAVQLLALTAAVLPRQERAARSPEAPARRASLALRVSVRLFPAGVIFDRAAQMRADLNLKTPDALHLAAAIEGGCDRFLTNDAGLRRCTDITVEVLP